MQTSRYSFLYPIALCSLLFGCAQHNLNLEESTDHPAVLELQARAADYTSWDMLLRVAVRHKKFSWRGTMQWTQHKDNFRMIFNNLLGQRLMLIESRGGGSAVAIDAKGNRKQDSDPSELIQSILNTEVPLASLPYWLFGAPTLAESYTGVKFNEQGLLQSYNQNGWDISYTEYREENCIDLPSGLILSQADTQLWLSIRTRRILHNTIQTSAC